MTAKTFILEEGDTIELYLKEDPSRSETYRATTTFDLEAEAREVGISVFGCEYPDNEGHKKQQEFGNHLLRKGLVVPVTLAS